MVAVSVNGADPNARSDRIRAVPDVEAAPEHRCKYDASLGYRMLPGRHHDLCDGGMGDCAGCQPCPENHCSVCGKAHVQQQTCGACIARVRQNITDTLHMLTLLPVAAVSHAHADIPGGTAQVLMGPYSDGLAALRLALREGDWTELDDDGIGPEPPLFTYATWEDAWRKEFNHKPAPDRATLTNTTDYLRRNMDRAAQQLLSFQEFAHDVHRARRRVEVAHNDHDPTVYGVACFDCGADLRQKFADPRPCQHHHTAPVPPTTRYPCGCDQGGRRDTWECTRCGRSYTEQDYRRAVRQAHTDAQPWRRAAEVTAITGVAAATLRRWANQGDIQAKPGNGRGWLYHVNEVRQRAMRRGMLAVYGPIPANIVSASEG